MVMQLPATAMGDATATMEIDYARSSIAISDSAGNATSSKSTDFRQLYFVRLENNLYPTISFKMGMVYDTDLVRSSSADTIAKSSATKMNPSAELGFHNYYFDSTLGYSEVTSKSTAQGIASPEQIQDALVASFGLPRKENRPSFNLLYQQIHTYDATHTEIDSLQKNITVSSVYQPAKQLDMRYTGTYFDTTDKLQGFDTAVTTNTGRMYYGDQFFRRRVRVYLDATVSDTKQVTSGAGKGELSQSILPAQGLSGAGPLGSDNQPETPANDTLTVNAALIDGNTTDGSGVNIGYSAAFPQPRNMGLDFGTVTEVNLLRVWVNQNLPITITNAYSWDIYTSSDTTDLKQWTLVQTVTAAPFGVFDFRFDLRINNVKTRFIKVVTKPLASPLIVIGVDVNNILITELQAYLNTPVVNGNIEQRNRSQLYETGAQVKLLNIPNLYYDVYYWYTKAETTSNTTLVPSTVSIRHIFTNSLSMTQRLGSVFGTSARFARSFDQDVDGSHVRDSYNATLTATPLKNLNHALTYYGQTDTVQGTTSSSSSVFLSNSATPYRGIDLSLGGGITEAKSGTAQSTKTESTTLGCSVVPYRTVTITLGYGTSRTWLYTANVLSSSSEGQSSSAGVTYSPSEMLYLLGNYGESDSTNRISGLTTKLRTQNYAMSWSPLLSGALFFSVSATDTLTSTDSGEVLSVSPTIQYIIRTGAIINVGYQLTKTKNNQENAKTETVFASFRLAI